MGRASSSVDRQARIELLRTRAALERETLAEQVAQAGRALGPGQLLRMALSGLGGSMKVKGDGGSWLAQALNLADRHPLLTSTLPSLLLNSARGRRIVRAASIALAGWQLYRAWRGAGQAEDADAAKTGKPK